MGAAASTDSVFAARTAGLCGRAGTPGIMCVPGQIQLAVPGGRYAAQPGGEVDGPGAQAGRKLVPVTPSGGGIWPRSAERAFAVLPAAGLGRNGQLRQVPAGDLIAISGAGGCRHAGLASARPGVRDLTGLARWRGLGVGDLECRLVRVELARGRAVACRPGGPGPHGAAAAGP